MPWRMSDPVEGFAGTTGDQDRAAELVRVVNRIYHDGEPVAQYEFIAPDETEPDEQAEGVA